MGRIGNLLNLLVTGAENNDIVANIKSDVGLSYRLLQRINSASFARINAGASIDQAVLLLGRGELYRWLSLLLFQFAALEKRGGGTVSGTSVEDAGSLNARATPMPNRHR